MMKSHLESSKGLWNIEAVEATLRAEQRREPRNKKVLLAMRIIDESIVLGRETEEK